MEKISSTGGAVHAGAGLHTDAALRADRTLRADTTLRTDGTWRAGIDIGSTTVKLVVTDASGTVRYAEYRRHLARTRDTLIELLTEARACCEGQSAYIRLTGSGAIGIAQALGLPFVQEVVAVASALRARYPQTDVAVELGGEDAKIIYFRGGLEERMNGICAGGTGSFIDQMAALLRTDAAGLNEAARGATELYPIASRCGVFAKSDIQPLINDGVARENIAASVFQAVVNQTVSGLACGKPIRGHVAFLGGPLHFLPELRAAFVRTLALTPDEIIDPPDSHLFAALGAAQSPVGEGEEPCTLDALIGRLSATRTATYESKRLPPLFSDRADYDRFLARHAEAKVARADISTYRGNCYLGIDAGSTTTKAVLIGEGGELLFSFYHGNSGDPVRCAMDAMAELAGVLPPTARIVRACSTGYGEQLLKSAFVLEESEVETVAHATAARFFDPETDCVLDIGGQDMKCIRLRDGVIHSILLNEACSSGCGSFIENFAASLGLSAAQFAEEACRATAPVDLGTRCTVFMNSNVKQAQKEGASLSDISAGLACSVIKNALYKVIKLSDASDLGRHIVVQGGTFYNPAVLRAMEQIAGVEVTCPDICGLMGAFGAALLARERYEGQEPTMLSFPDIAALEYHSTTARCGGCENNCLLTVNRFSGGRRYITGNRCEKKLGGGDAARRHGENLYEYKLRRLFDYPMPEASDAPRGTIGIPRVLNIYENYPFWATFFRTLGFRVVLSPTSSAAIYRAGMDSIPSESECYPAKLVHGHVRRLIGQGIDTIFHPCIFHERRETPYAQNCYNCPMVISYPENIKNNMEEVMRGEVRYLHPFLTLTEEKETARRLSDFCRETWNIPAAEVRRAVSAAWAEQERAKEDIRAEGARVLRLMEERGERGIVLAGRPYHIDPGIHHGIPDMIASFGLHVLSEDSLPLMPGDERRLRVLDQWTYHSRLYNAAEFVRSRADLEMIQLNSFGCGLDAVTTDQVHEILSAAGKAYTVLKIDEVSNLGAARIRVRSLLAAMRGHSAPRPTPPHELYSRREYTKEMHESGYTLLAPQMSPFHFDLLEPVFRRFGFRLEILNNATRHAVDIGLKYVNNDACYPSIIMVGQMMEAVLSGRYDTDRLALLMTQTGGGCRASNYVGFIRRALERAGLSHIPVVSLNAVGLEPNSGFSIKPYMLRDGMKALVWGDLLMRCLYRVRPYEAEPGAANALYETWRDRCIARLSGNAPRMSDRAVCRGIVNDFDALPLRDIPRKPRVGIVGEILVKYMPLANNHLVDLLEREGAEVVVPDFLDFITSCVWDMDFASRALGAPAYEALVARLGVGFLNRLRRPAARALAASKRFTPPVDIRETAHGAEDFLSPGNQCGEGWLLCGEMVELIRSGAPNIVCIQPFGCLPNHVVGKGVIKALREVYPQANIAAVDYDPGASEVNQLNRIKLMLATARERAAEETGNSTRPM